METQENNRGFRADFRHFFLRGLAALLPSLLSLVLIINGYKFIDEYVGYYINKAIIWLIGHLQAFLYEGTAEQFQAALRHLWVTYHLDIGGFIIAICLVYFFGMFLASFVGHWLWRMIERVLNRTPVVGQVYPYVKQVTDFFLRGQRLNFTQVVAVEYPRKGVWSLGLVTGSAPWDLQSKTGQQMISVFIPSSPTPLTGYVVCLARSEAVDLSISVDQAFRFVISGGVLKPGSEFAPRRSAPAAELTRDDDTTKTDS